MYICIGCEYQCLSEHSYSTLFRLRIVLENLGTFVVPSERGRLTRLGV
jgi:hypothetical protein